MDAARKIEKYGDKEKEKALAEQWVKNEPERRITKKSSVVRARGSEPDKKIVNQHEIDKLKGMVKRSLEHVNDVDPNTPVGLKEAAFAKNLASRIEKHGVKSGPASAMATIAGMHMNRLRLALSDSK